MARRANLIAKKPKKNRVSRSESYLVNVKYMGEEPKFNPANELTDSQIGAACTWYNYMCTTEDARSYIIDYLTYTDRKHDLFRFNKLSDIHVNMTAAWIARLLINGYLVPDSSMNYLSDKIYEMLSRVRTVSEQSATIIKLNVQDRIRDKTNDLIGEIEAFVDRNEPFSMYEYLKKNEIPSLYGNSIVSYYAPILQELLEIDDDEQLREGYAYMSKPERKKRIVFLNDIISDAERYSNNVKKTRTPSKPRPIKIEKVVQNLKFQKEDFSLKLVSIKPESIIGASELWSYNTKYKILTVFRALDRAGLQIKGTSILNYDEKTSVGKSVGRKSEEYTQRVLNGGKIILKKLMDEIKTNNVFTNRTSEFTILLKVVK